LVADDRVRARHVGADRHGPDRELVPGQQVAGEREEERQDEEHDPDAPVELPGRLVRAGHEDAEQVQPHGDDHRGGAAAVELARRTVSSSSWAFWVLATQIPLSCSKTWNRSRGRGVGPSKLTPFM